MGEPPLGGDCKSAHGRNDLHMNNTEKLCLRLITLGGLNPFAIQEVPDQPLGVEEPSRSSCLLIDLSPPEVAPSDRAANWADVLAPTAKWLLDGMQPFTSCHLRHSLITSHHTLQTGCTCESKLTRTTGRVAILTRMPRHVRRHVHAEAPVLLLRKSRLGLF